MQLKNSYIDCMDVAHEVNILSLISEFVASFSINLDTEGST
jgi:hypothetical protein